MDIAPLNYWNPLEEQVKALPKFHEFDILKTQGSAKKRKTRDSVLDFMEGFRQRKKNNVAREPSQERNVSEVEKSDIEELLDCSVAYANDDIAKELCLSRKVSEVKEVGVYVAYADDNHSERRVQVFHCLTGFPKKKRSVPADDTTSSTGHQHRIDQNKLEINVTTTSMLYKEDEKQDHQKQQKQKRKYQKKERSKVKKMREKGKKKKSFPPASAPPQEVPQIICNTISALGGTTPVWLNEKKLSNSDSLRQQARLFLPLSTALLEFLTPAEREKCLVLKSSSNGNNQNKKKNQVIVTVVNPEGETSEMKFKNWGSLDQYVLSGTNWNNLVTKFNMVPLKTKLHLWCFRKTDSNKLCFAIDTITEDRG